jgi:hypothetical protein
MERSRRTGLTPRRTGSTVRGGFVCAGDTALTSANLLASGEKIVASSIKCTSTGWCDAATVSAHRRTRRSDPRAPRSSAAKGFVRLRRGGLSSSFATGDDLARGVRM